MSNETEQQHPNRAVLIISHDSFRTTSLYGLIISKGSQSVAGYTTRQQDQGTCHLRSSDPHPTAPWQTTTTCAVPDTIKCPAPQQDDMACSHNRICGYLPMHNSNNTGTGFQITALRRMTPSTLSSTSRIVSLVLSMTIASSAGLSGAIARLLS